MGTGLLLLYVFATEVLDAETRPIDFVCDRESRRGINTVVAMEAALVCMCLGCVCVCMMCTCMFVCMYFIPSISMWPEWPSHLCLLFVQADCYALSTLPFPVQLPCIKVHKASWDNKSVCNRTHLIQLNTEGRGLLVCSIPVHVCIYVFVNR